MKPLVTVSQLMDSADMKFYRDTHKIMQISLMARTADGQDRRVLLWQHANVVQPIIVPSVASSSSDVIGEAAALVSPLLSIAADEASPSLDPSSGPQEQDKPMSAAMQVQVRAEDNMWGTA